MNSLQGNVQLFISKTDKHLSTAYRHDLLSIRILKICDYSLCGSLGLIFQSYFENDKFPPEWKKEMLFLLIRKTIKN